MGAESVGNNRFGLALDAYRVEHGLTQKAVAELVGASQTRVSSWIRGEGFPEDPATRRRICDLIGFDPTELERARNRAILRGTVETAEQIADLVERNADLTAQVAELRSQIAEVLHRLGG